MLNKRNLIILLVAYKLFLLGLFIPLAYNLAPFYEASYQENTVFSDDELLNTRSPYKTWDSYNFLYIAKKGYSEGHNKFNVLFPLFPVLIKFFLPIFNGNAVACGILLSNIFSLIGMLYFYYLARRYFNQAIALASLFMLLAFPTSFYLSIIYSESLFFMLVMMFFYYAFDRKYLPAAISAFFLPLTRLTGISIALLFLVIYFENLKQDYNIKLPALFKKIKIDALYLLFPVFGFIALLVFFYFTTGNAFEWLDSQKIYIARHSVGNILNPITTLYNNFFRTRLVLHGYTNSIIDRTVFILFVSSLFFIFRQQRFSLFLYAFLTGLLPGISGNMMSYTRYLSMVFPLYYFLGINFNIEKKRTVFFLLLMVFLLIQGVFLARHINYYWVG
ncbi:MAG: glycosyltransferase family 39 protein [Candidatus Omnitrophica bacterium]|nr:glycosyltransferase family 39 protein [Candidatus Omnitrophota bacterium]MBU4590171.1 glycosyltransferase family 39 protein [Candidatus Omnitrophota bacterium]